MGDKVTKGQVVCIVEAMKLMNEIEVSFTQQELEKITEASSTAYVVLFKFLQKHVNWCVLWMFSFIVSFDLVKLEL